MIVQSAGSGISVNDDGWRSDEVLSESERSHVFRRFAPGGTIICKEFLGRTAARRSRHERAMLERLSTVPGVPKLCAGAFGTTTIALHDDAGAPLSAVLRSERLEMGVLLPLALRLTETVAAIHRHGIVHRDINPSNILLAGSERLPVLIDFDGASTFADERSVFTTEDEIEGTLAYIAPEQTGRTGRVTDERADLYSLGATLYELATGHVPFEGGDAFQVVRDHLLRVPKAPSALAPEVPRAFSEIVMRLLQKEPDRRYQSAEGLAADLATLIEARARGDNATFPLGIRDFPRRLLPSSGLVGRGPEIVALRSAFEDAKAGRGSGLLVGGAPGVGKTTLLNELRPMVTARAGWFVTGKFDQYRRDLDSNAVRGALRDLFRLLLAEPEEELAPIRVRLIEALGPNGALAAAILPELGVLLGIAPQASAGAPLNAQARLAQIGLELLKSIASKGRPVVFVIDDLQWAPAATLTFIDALISEGGSPGLLAVGVYRSADVDAAHPLSAMLSRWDRLDAPPRKLALKNLTEDDLGSLLLEMLRLDRSQALQLAAAVFSRTAGNPYDTVEFVNALRRDGFLTPGADGWKWDEAVIRRYVGDGDVVELLAARIDALPPESARLLETMACLGGEVEYALLQVAAGCSDLELERCLTPALDDGLLVLERGARTLVRFRHDRVEQTAYGRLQPGDRILLHLSLARRLSAAEEYQGFAAEQYLTSIAAILDPREGVEVIELFRGAAAQARLLANYSVAERFLGASLKLSHDVGVNDAGLELALEGDYHTALYNLGQLDEADDVYRSIEARTTDPLELVDSACVQISSLTNRKRPREAVALGLDILARLGIVPPGRGTLGAETDRRVHSIDSWSDAEAARNADPPRQETTEPHVVAAAKVIRRMVAPAIFGSQAIFGWLVLESFRLWSEYGPLAALIGPASHAAFVTAAFSDDYRIGYRAVRQVLAAGEARGYEPETSIARFELSLGSAHWFEPLEACLAHARAAHEGLVRGGDLQTACFTYFASAPLLFESAPTIEQYSQDVAAGLAFSIRTGNDQTADALLGYRQLAKSLLGDTDALGSFTDRSFDEAAHLSRISISPTATATFYITRAGSALIFGQTADLIRYTDAAMPLMRYVVSSFPTAAAHLFRAIAMAHRVRAASPDEHAPLLQELDASRDWLQRRAGDSPESFLHYVRLVDAERAWALGDLPAANDAFEAALVATPVRRWRRALVAERAGLFHLQNGLHGYGRLLLIEARRRYEAWGATAKVRQLRADYPFLLDEAGAAPSGPRVRPSESASSEAIDMVGILRASQALSSQTSLTLLKARVVELLAGLTGATAVQLVVKQDAAEDWLFSPDAASKAAPMTAKEAGARGLLALTALRYVERTHEPLLLADAMRDDRFARDPYFAGCEQCSMLVVPILSQGELRAVLLLENRLGRGAFSTSRLDAVMLISGQLAVSLENALVYASLEQKVAERTEALAAANQQLALLSVTDALTGLPNRRRFDEALEREWRRARRTKSPIALAMIDVDEFKKYNDRFGHAAGDACLRRVADTLAAGLRPSDLVARYGGEEFVLILSNTDAAGAFASADRLREGVANLRDLHTSSAHGIVTISVGLVVCSPSEGGSAAEYLQAADVALYEAKRKGRNRVEHAPFLR